MADSGSPYRRVGANSWEELLDQVNDVLQNPDDGCDPLDPIEVPEAPHRWSKSDIREVHNRLNEMPGDCFDFADIPDLWKKSIITDIEEQLENAWCECEDECPICSDEPVTEPVWAIEEWKACGCPQTEHCATYSPPEAEANVTLRHWLDLAREAIGDYLQAAGKACELEVQKHALEAKIRQAEADRDAACPGPGCAAAQAALDALNDELDEIQSDLDTELTNREDAKSIADTASEAGWEFAKTVAFVPHPESFGMEAPNTTEEWRAALGTFPWADSAEKECKTDPTNAGRCRSSWLFQVSPDAENFHTRVTGAYSPSGIPYPPPNVDWLFRTGACYVTCFILNDPGACFPSGPPPEPDHDPPATRVKIFHPECPPEPSEPPAGGGEGGEELGE